MTPPGIDTASAPLATPNVPDGSTVHVRPSIVVQAGSGIWSPGCPSARYPPAHVVTDATATGPPSIAWSRISVHAADETGGKEPLGAPLGGDDGADDGVALEFGDGVDPAGERNPPGRRPSPTATIRTAAIAAAKAGRARTTKIGRLTRRSMASSIRRPRSSGARAGSMVR